MTGQGSPQPGYASRLQACSATHLDLKRRHFMPPFLRIFCSLRIPAALACLLAIQFQAGGCISETRTGSLPAEEAIYTAVLDHLSTDPVAQGMAAIYPRLIKVDPEYGALPGDKPEHFLRGRPAVLANAVAAFPELALCPDDPIRCAAEYPSPFVIFSAIEYESDSRAQLWVLLVGFQPKPSYVRYDMAQLERGPTGWSVASYKLVGTEHSY